ILIKGGEGMVRRIGKIFFVLIGGGLGYQYGDDLFSMLNPLLKPNNWTPGRYGTLITLIILKKGMQSHFM
ncbi:hypothetical protein SB773_31795, partial [Bacillus sp. SIMBA_074]